jgi:hypothetical protein
MKTMTNNDRTEYRNVNQAIGEVSLALLDALEAGDRESADEARDTLKRLEAKRDYDARARAK